MASFQFPISSAAIWVIIKLVMVVGNKSASAVAPPSLKLNRHTSTPSVTEAMVPILVLGMVSGSDGLTLKISEAALPTQVPEKFNT